MKFFDIGANLTDPVFKGIYRGKQKHPSDFDDILKRAADVGLVGYLITGLISSNPAIEEFRLVFVNSCSHVAKNNK